MNHVQSEHGLGQLVEARDLSRVLQRDRAKRLSAAIKSKKNSSAVSAFTLLSNLVPVQVVFVLVVVVVHVVHVVVVIIVVVVVLVVQVDSGRLKV